MEYREKVHIIVIKKMFEDLVRNSLNLESVVQILNLKNELATLLEQGNPVWLYTFS